MSLRYFTRKTVLTATTTNPWQTNFNHLLPIPKLWLKRSTIRDPKIKSVRPKDRIKYWNIVPGDQIRLRGDKSKTIHEVLSINRMSSRVFVKGAAQANADANKPPPTKNYHYAKCQVLVGNYEFPAGDGVSEPKVLPVFAQRVGTSHPTWDRLRKRYVWQRFAVRTVPVIPYAESKRIEIPWPKPEKRSLPEPANYDTTREEVVKVTYKLPTFQQSSEAPIPRPATEDEFLASLYNPHLTTLNDSEPVEIYLAQELANPHSRAKKLMRWKIRQANDKALLDEIVANELEHLNGRSERDAKAEAAFRWRELLKERKDDERKRRWKDKAEESTMKRKAMRKENKEARLRRRLTELVLSDSPNQVIPKLIN